ncbi:MAG: flagellar hook protein FlgE [Candidatus Latescibacteria bacterium]|nr:flagellar hook protein FlgE [Candidatus Latescibacterota bacterium]
MMNSLFAGVSGLRNHLTKMDVIGNNIANINTLGFKAGRTTFKEMLAQTIRGASRQRAATGGVNPLQYGLGMAVASIDNIFSQGGLEMTGKSTDLAIQGNGFFILSDGVSNYYTRAGNFSYDATGYLVDPGTGYILQGKMADSVTGEIPSGTAIEDIQLPLGQTAPANATTKVSYSGNLDAAANLDDSYSTSIRVYDSLGDTHTLTLTFTKEDGNKWKWTASVTGAEAGSVSGNSGTVTFESDGSLDPTKFKYDNDATSFEFTPDNGAALMSITFDPGTGFNGLTQFRSPSTAIAKSQDGYGMGTLDSISIDSSGVISGIFTNGVTRNLAQIVLADFNNPAGLLKVGDNMYQESANSGQAVKGIARSTISGSVSSGYLEMSNVDLAQEFTKMIIAQRGFQANARTITTTDNMLGELVNLKR